MALIIGETEVKSENTKNLHPEWMFLKLCPNTNVLQMCSECLFKIQERTRGVGTEGIGGLDPFRFVNYIIHE